MSDGSQERQILDLVLPKLSEAGYSVYAHPPRQVLPAFMGDYRPDAIALGRPKNLAIEIVREGAGGAGKASWIAERFVGIPDWELRVFYIRSGRSPDAIAGVSQDVIEKTLAKVEALEASRQNEAAILLGWSAFEAIGRVFAPDRLSSAQPAARLIEFLAADGVVTPDEADALRRFGEIRDQIAHGALQTTVESADLHAFLATMKTLMRENMTTPAIH